MIPALQQGIVRERSSDSTLVRVRSCGAPPTERAAGKALGVPLAAHPRSPRAAPSPRLSAGTQRSWAIAAGAGLLYRHARDAPPTPGTDEVKFEPAPRPRRGPALSPQAGGHAPHVGAGTGPTNQRPRPWPRPQLDVLPRILCTTPKAEVAPRRPAVGRDGTARRPARTSRGP